MSKLLGVAYIYVGRGDQSTVKPSSNPTTAYSQGQQDALEAKNFAINLSISSDSVIYLDIEGGNIHDNVTVEYVKGWVAKINADTNYWAGIYCSAGANLSVASQLYTAVNKKANMWVAKWMCDSGKSYDSITDTCFQTNTSNPAKWYDIDPTDAVPGVGCIMRQYSGNVYISLQGYTGYVDQDSCLYADPSIKQFT